MSRGFIRGLLVALLPGLAAADAAVFEPPRFTRYGIGDGLSQSSVTALAQDRRGFLWVGTLDGLNRFDGYDFRVFRPAAGEDGALADGAVTALAAHPDGSVWVGTIGGGLARYDPVTDRFATLHTDSITALVVDRTGAVWVGTPRGLSRAAPAGAAQWRLTPVSDAHITSLAAHADGGVWVGHDDGTVLRDATGSGEPVRVADALPAGRAVRAMAATPDRGIWVASDGPHYARLDAGGSVRSRHRLSAANARDEPRLRALAVDGEGRLWLAGLAMGVAVFDLRDGSYKAALHRASDPRSLSHDDVLSLWRDPSEALWIGTLSGGLNRVRIASSGFAHYWHQPGNPASLSHNTVTAFAHDADGRIWVGTDGGGLNRFDVANAEFEHTALVRDTRGQAGLNRIWSLHVDRDGGVWVGTWGAGLHHRPRGRTTFERVSAVTSLVVSAFAEDDAGLWVASRSGLFRIPRSGGPVEAHFAQQSLTALERAGDGRLWIGSWSSGLYLFDAQTGQVEHFRATPEDAASLPHDAIRALIADGDRGLWVATGAGLARFDAASRRFRRYGVPDGLPAGAVYSLERDDDGRLWLGTNAGIVRFDPATGAARSFGPEDGVQDFEFNGGAHHRLPDGRLLFGGLNGFNLFDPRAIPPAPEPGPVQIVEILLANRPALSAARDAASPLAAAAAELDTLTLGPRNNVLGIRFVAALSAAPRQVRYAYRLDEFDESWQPAGPNQRLAVYTNLPAGRYVFRVRAGSAEDQWSTKERTLRLRILPPWWASTWAYGGYAAAVLIGFAAFFHWRTRGLRARAALLEAGVLDRTAQLARQTRIIKDQALHLQQALETKERLFARVSHEFRTPLTLILGPIEALLADEKPGRTAAWLRLMRRNARRLLSLVDQLLGLARLSGEAPLQPTAQQVAPVVRGTVAAFDSMAVAKGVGLAVDRLDDAWASATPELLERMVTNLVSNAVKYTQPGGHVRVAVIDEGALVSIVVADDGPGIPREHQQAIFEPFHRVGDGGTGTGIGLALVRECAQVLGGSVAVESEQGRGATFSIRLPACAPQSGSSVPEAEAMVQTERMLLEAEVAAEAVRPTDDRALAASLGARGGDEARARVLIVEDNTDLRVLLLAALDRGYRCATAANGRLGIVAAIEDPPDLVVSDVMMPETDGFELTRTLKRDPRTSHVPIVLLTALGDRDSLLKGLEEHADEYLVKPFDAEELRLRVRNLIEARQILGQRAARAVYDDAQPIARTAAVDLVSHSPRERAFLQRLRGAAQAGYADAGFGVTELAGRVAMSERQLQRKLRALLDVSPAEYLREFRLQEAVVLLRAGRPAGNVAFDVGFATPSHFGACFKARFGTPPGEYAASFDGC